MLTITLAEAITAHLIRMGRMDDTNPQLIRAYQKRAAELFGTSRDVFYLEEYEVDDYEFENLAEALIDSMAPRPTY